MAASTFDHWRSQKENQNKEQTWTSETILLFTSRSFVGQLKQQRESTCILMRDHYFSSKQINIFSCAKNRFFGRHYLRKVANKQTTISKSHVYVSVFPGVVIYFLLHKKFKKKFEVIYFNQI